MKLLPVAICCLLSTQLNAQQYLIKYDIQSQRSEYYRINKTKDTVKIKHIDLKKNGRIFLQINNYNPFYWNAKVTAYKTPVEEEVGYGNAFNPISVLAGGMGDLMGGLPQLDLPKNRGNLSREGLDNATYSYLSTATKYADNYDDLQQLATKLEELQLAKLQLKELKYDINHTEGEIKSSALESIKKALNTDKTDLPTVLSIGKTYNSRLQNSLQEAGSLVNSLQQQQKLVDPNKIYEEKTLKEIGENAVSSYDKIAKLRAAQAANPNLLMDEVAEIAQLYKEISSANFKFSYAVKQEEDISDIKLELYPKIDSGSKDTVVQYFELSKKKNVRIRNSVGVAFSFFNENNTSYFIGADSIIRRGDKDLFTPLLSTFIHFYAGKVKGVKLGGAFGFGIPLQGEKKDVNFLLGLTAGFGKNEPVLFTIGAAGAKVNKLTNGYNVGDKTNLTDPTKLTASGYGIGGFVSVTFNLSNLGIGKK
ncbi:MAG: hypothetical protein EOP53_08955 [Sphingobacteriales bacterium]|nr:MAG: hypothetical protein EOP53_08955 [Sphingobacteriales bacterium]